MSLVAWVVPVYLVVLAFAGGMMTAGSNGSVPLVALLPWQLLKIRPIGFGKGRFGRTYRIYGGLDTSMGFGDRSLQQALLLT